MNDMFFFLKWINKNLKYFLDVINLVSLIWLEK